MTSTGRRGGQVAALPTTNNVALGVLPGHTFNQETVQLEAGDMLFFYTDGVTEAEGPGSEELGEERLDALLASLDDSSCGEVTARVLDCVREFAAGNAQSDDITCVALRCRGG